MFVTVIGVLAAPRVWRTENEEVNLTDLQWCDEIVLRRWSPPAGCGDHRVTLLHSYWSNNSLCAITPVVDHLCIITAW